MSSATRRLAQLIGQLLLHVYPRRDRAWAQAMRSEIDLIEGGAAALLFALGCLSGALRHAASGRFYSVQEGSSMTNDLKDAPTGRPIGIFCACAATMLGLVYLAAAGAPLRYIVVNAVALVLGIVALRGIGAAHLRPVRLTSGATAALGLCLLATALFGTPVDGASRWIWLGPLGVQVSLVFLPLMIVLFARHAGPMGTFGMSAAALAMVLQPDRAMAAVLALGTAILAVTKPDRWTIMACLASFVCCAAAIARPDTLAAVPYVDQILFTAFDVHILAGAGVVFGSLLLLVPAVAGVRADPARRHIYLVFGVTWLGCVLAAALGNYPTPVVGYGGSAILGYLLSLSVLPVTAESAHSRATCAAQDRPGEDRGALRTAVAA